MNENLANAILACGQRYREEHLFGRYKAEALLTDWWEALKFFFGRAFYVGRSDEVSGKVYTAAVSILEPNIARTDGQLDDVRLSDIEQQLRAVIGKGMIGKPGDIKMVVSALEYVRRIPRANIVADSVVHVENGMIGAHYRQLQKAASPQTGIYQVGPKVAAFYLRDLVMLFNLERHVPAQFLYTLQPVDTWVERLAKLVGIAGPDATNIDTAQAIVSYCAERGCSALQFNQGMWYLGANAYGLLLEVLEQHADILAPSAKP